jgi:signal transduction histidine kinase
MKAKKLVAGVLIVLALLAVGLIDAHYGFALPVWSAYLVPISVAAITFETIGGVVAGAFAGLMLFSFSPAAKTWGMEILLGWLLGFIGWGGVLGYFQWQARSFYEVSKRLQDQEHLRDALIEFLVHDLRSPLTNIISGLETLLVSTEDNLTPEDRELIEMALIGAHRLLTMVNSILDLRKLEEGKFPLYLKEFEPREAVGEAIRQVQLWARQSNINLQVEFEPNVPEKMIADRWVLIRILVNLLSNALKYTPSGGTIKVRVFMDDGWVHFSVADQGPGIPKEYLDRIFDRFVQVEARKAGAAVGTGLGLTFCKLAVEAHGGRIWIESEVGKGTTVHFVLPPITKGELAEQSSVAPPIPQSHDLPSLSFSALRNDRTIWMISSPNLWTMNLPMPLICLSSSMVVGCFSSNCSSTSSLNKPGAFRSLTNLARRSSSFQRRGRTFLETSLSLRLTAGGSWFSRTLCPRSVKRTK